MTMASDLREVQRFRDVIARRLGLYFDETKLAFLSEQLKSRSQSNAQSSEVYLARWECEPPQQEVRALAPLLTVAETYFFRNDNQFQALRELAVPECWQRREGSGLRILSAGCASGEEPYSIAIAAREVLGEAAQDISIRAVDLNPAVLDHARRARYNRWALRETAPDTLHKWFQHASHDAVVLDPAIRSAVSFDEGNLMDPDAQLWRSGCYDIIFCRNVLMYFTPANMQAVVGRLARALTPGGYLFLGHAETLRGISQDFHLCHTHDTFYYRLKDAGLQTDARLPSAIPAARPPEGRSTTTPAHAGTMGQGADTWSDVIQKAAMRIRSLASPVLPPQSASTGRELALARDLLKEERYAEALALIQALPLQSARDPEVRLLEGVLLTHCLQLDQAENLCRELLADDELNAGAHYLLALCRERAGDHGGATEHDQYAVYLDPAFAMPRLHLGLLARRNDDAGRARRELAQAHILLQREDASRLLLFGGGFNRETLLALCRAELLSCGGNA